MPFIDVFIILLIVLMTGVLLGAILLLLIRKPYDNGPNVIDMLDEIIVNHKDN